MNKQSNPLSGYVCPNCFRQVDACTCEHGPQHLIQIDEGIQDAVRILNEKGYRTSYCCESHYQSANTWVYVSFGQEWGFQILPAGFTYNRIHKRLFRHSCGKPKAPSQQSSGVIICIPSVRERNLQV